MLGQALEETKARLAEYELGQGQGSFLNAGAFSAPATPQTMAAASAPERSHRDFGRGPLKRHQVNRGRPDALTRSQGGSADTSIKERGGPIPPRKAQEGVLGRWDLAR
jgi:hypothetical protein